MSNLKSAKQAIKAELEHARQGVMFYQSRVEALEEALEKIDSVEAVGEKGGNGKSQPAAKRAKPGRKPRAQATGNGAKLPFTGKDFWPSLITSQPQSAREILDAAVRTLGITPSKDQLKKLSQRQTSALHNLIKTNVIADSGAGRERRFFKR